MSSTQYENSGASNLFQQILRQFQNPDSKKTISQLFEAIQPSSFEALGSALQELLKSHKLKARYLVHSPSGENLKSFASFDLIPSVLPDESQRPFKVGLTDIEVVFQARNE